MTEEYYYLEASNESVGPVSWDVLQQLHRAGVVDDDTSAAPSGASEWSPFAKLKELRERQATLPPVPGHPAAVQPASAHHRHQNNPALPASGQMNSRGAVPVGETQRTQPIQWMVPLILFAVTTALFIFSDAGELLHREGMVTVFSSLGVMVGIPSLVFVCMLHYQCWHALPPQYRATSPGKAVGFLFIPFFQFYWAFVTWPKLAEGYLRWQQDRGMVPTTDARSLALIYASVFAIEFVLTWIPGLASFVSFAHLTVFALYYRQMVETANRLILGEEAFAGSRFRAQTEMGKLRTVLGVTGFTAGVFTLRVILDRVTEG